MPVAVNSDRSRRAGHAQREYAAQAYSDDTQGIVAT
jgi:hypothetical protein